MNKDYLKILQAFNNAKIKELNKIYDLKKPFLLGSLFFLFLCFMIFFINQTYLAVGLIVFGLTYAGFIFKIMNDANKKIVQHFGLDNDVFLSNNSDYWRGARALLFFKSLVEQNIQIISDEIITMIEKEQSLKELKILDMSFQIGGFAVVGMAIEKILDEFELTGLTISLILAFTFLLSHAYFVVMFRTEKSKMNDLLLFINWYNTFGQELFKTTSE